MVNIKSNIVGYCLDLTPFNIYLETYPLYPVRVPNGVYPPPLIREGELVILEGEAPLFPKNY